MRFHFTGDIWDMKLTREKKNVYVGYDLGEETSQISFF